MTILTVLCAFSDKLAHNERKKPRLEEDRNLSVFYFRAIMNAYGYLSKDEWVFSRYRGNGCCCPLNFSRYLPLLSSAASGSRTINGANI